jgi:hypothetical protein
MKQRVFFEEEPVFTDRNVKSVTFQGKLDLPIHRWYRLTPSFSPKLAWDLAEYFKLGSDDLVFDPFSGVGTVPLCMKYRGIPACSIELNPYLFFVGTVKTRTYSDLERTAECFSDFLAVYKEALRSVRGDYLEANQEFIPRISSPGRWWSDGNLAQLVCLRKTLLAYEADPIHLDLLKMGVLGILIPVSNAKHNHVSVTFTETPLPTVDVHRVLRTKYKEMMDDLREVSTLPCSEVRIYHGNSKEAFSVLPTGTTVSAIITSPPYPNRFSYARETRPHLFFFDFIDDAKAVGDLETAAIGGTWGKATSALMAGVEPANDVVGSLLAPYIGNINGSGPLMAHYVTKYFNDIYTHASEIAKLCRKPARLAYVIGNSKFYDHHLPSDEILARIFTHFGFSLERIDRMRKRQSKKGLYEAVVFMTR